MNTAHTFARRSTMAAFGLVAVLALAACGGDDDDAATPTEAPAATAAAAPATTATPAPTTSTPPASPAVATDDDYGDPYGPAPEVTEPAESTAPAAAPAAGAAVVATAETDLGAVLVDVDGMTLYGFTNDTDGEPTCTGGCAEAWPPALVEGEPSFGDLDAAVFSIVEHPLGSQLKAGDWPLYTFAGDTAPGDTNGQGSGGIWFVVAPDGSLIQ